MSDAQHMQQKEALQDGANRVLAEGYRGLPIGNFGFTMVGMWVTHDDGSSTGPNIAPPVFTLDKTIKAVLDAWLDGTALPPAPGSAQPPPVNQPPPPPPPPDTGSAGPGESNPDGTTDQPGTFNPEAGT